MSTTSLGQDGTDRLYGAGGVGPGFEFDGTVFAPINLVDGAFPSYPAVHKNHLFFGFSGGSLLHSVVGFPTNFSALAGGGEIAVGDNVTALRPLPGGVLAVGCENKIEMLYGNDVESFQLQKFTDHGTKPYSFGEVGGNTLALDDRGVQNIAVSQAYGDFESTSQSRLINPLILGRPGGLLPTASFVSKGKSQYRLFFGQRGYYFTYAGDVFVGVTPVDYADAVRCAVVGEDDTLKEVSYFGSDDGKVFKVDDSYKFDGKNIVSFFRSAFNFLRPPLPESGSARRFSTFRLREIPRRS